MGKRLVIHGADFFYSAIGSSVVAAPTFSPAAGQYNEVSVQLSSVSVGASIYYTTNGTTPTTGSTLYTGAITLDTIGTTTIKAIAVKNGVSSAVSTATYEIVEEIIMPTSVAISGDNGTLTERTLQLSASVSPAGASQEVTWSVQSGSATISSSGLLTIDSASMSGSVTVRATSNTDNSVYADKTITYAIPLAGPTISLNSDGDVVITGDGEIRYTTDGSTPTTSSSVYSAAIQLAHGTTTVKAICVSGGQSSSVTSKEFMKCDTSDCTIVGGIYATNGNFDPTFTLWESTDYVDVSAFSQFALDVFYPATNFGIAWYDSSKAFISGIKYGSTVMKESGSIPQGAAYVRMCYQINQDESVKYLKFVVG